MTHPGDPETKQQGSGEDSHLLRLVSNGANGVGGDMSCICLHDS